MKEVLVDTPQDERDVLFVTSDNRTIGARILGPEYGVPILTLHGNPGSRIGPHVSSSVLEEFGCRLIAPDRPGYGLSDRNEGRKIADTAADMAELMDWLGVKEFGVLARSGGVPHALACAALLGERVFGVVSFAGLAPKTATIDWVEGMTEDNKAKHATAIESPEKLFATMQQHAESIRQDPYHILNMLWEDLRPPDRTALIAEPIGQQTSSGLIASHQEGLRQGGGGWTDDTLALHEEWGFAVQAIQSPVTLWHGLQDPFASPDHSQWLAQEIPNATLVENVNGSHMSSLLYGYKGLQQLRNLYIGPGGEKLLERRIQEAKHQIFNRIGVAEQAPAQPCACDECFQVLEFTDEDMRRRVALSIVETVLPTIAETLILETNKDTD